MKDGLRRPAGLMMLAVVTGLLLFGMMSLTVFSAQGQPEGAVGSEAVGLVAPAATPFAADFQFDKKVKLRSDYDVNGCAIGTAFDSLTVYYSTTVAYCYYFTNIGTTTWITVSMIDDKLGEIPPTAVNVIPNGQIGLGATPPALLESVTNTATWTATDDMGNTLSRTDVVTVTVVGPLEGYMFFDTDGDGVRDPNEMGGLPGVTLNLEPEPADPELSRETTSGAAGRYEFLDAVDGDYTVTAQLPAAYEATSPLQVPVTLVSGETQVVNFGVRAFATYLPVVLR